MNYRDFFQYFDISCLHTLFVCRPILGRPQGVLSCRSAFASSLSYCSSSLLERVQEGQRAMNSSQH